ncbi:MAG: ABC transporter ATP-binding protein [Tabrizicola flagellatus]|uniref:ABC transporter ATP-binding protein n=1 Tax=Tabrizicola flagellatus TaxID=2593021 RepID=UPI00391AED52
MTRLTLEGLAKTYARTGPATLHGLDLTVESGSLTALLGPSGSGKTTTMKLIAGLIAPDAGDIRLDDRSIRDLPPEQRGVAMVFQNPLLFPHLTVAGNVGFGLRMRGLPPDRISAEVAAMLARVRLSDLADRRPAQLSGGQAQRAALARALVLRPAVLLLDEPLSSLDATLRDEMRGLIRDLQRETGITTLVVTHDQAEAVALADCIALLLDGRLAQHGPPEAFYSRPASEAVARFFGGVNFLPGTARGGRFDGPLGPLDLLPDLTEGPGLLTIRPEAIRLGPGPNRRDARVRAVTFLGTQTRIDLTVQGVALQAFVAPDAGRALSPGSEVPISLPPAALWVVPRGRAATGGE